MHIEIWLGNPFENAVFGTIDNLFLTRDCEPQSGRCHPSPCKKGVARPGPEKSA
jgi:hypothetical protein